jgi:uncharacterized protein (TIGR02231 family)
MRYLLLLLYGFAFLPASVFAAEPVRLQATSRITAVTVYPDRAMTARSATISLKPGSYTVVFDGLPAVVLDDSVRVSGKGTAGVTILGLELKRSFAEQVPEKRAVELAEEIRALERKVAGLDARKAALVSQRSFLDSIRVAWGERISKELAVGKPAAGELAEALTFVGSGVVKVEEQGIDLELEKQQLKDRIDALRRQRDDALGSRRKEARYVEVNLDVTRGGELELELASMVTRAGWEPVYDARLAADGKSLELLFRAMVHQQSGEEWHNVNLSLSTAKPSQGGAPPELYPWRVAFFRPVPPMSPAPVRSMKMKAQAAAAEAVQNEILEPAPFQTAQISEEQNSVTFLIPREVTIPSDGSQHSTMVATETMPVALEFQAVPKLSPWVFLKSEITNKASYPLLSGRINIFTSDNYIGSSHLKKVASGEKFDLFFGTDDQITVKREELKSHKEAGLFGRNRMGYRYRIELQNFRKEPQTITIRDQLPIAGNDEIKVFLDEPNLKPDEAGNDGTLLWKVLVGGGEKRELTFGILVEYPKDRELSGL